MNDFKQLIRLEGKEQHKERIRDFITLLEISEGVEYECVIKPYKQSKTLEQLGYYWGVIIPVVRLWQGLTVEEADILVKDQCIEPVYKEIMGKTYEIRKSIAKMKVGEMSKYIDDAVNFLGVNGQPVPPPPYRHDVYSNQSPPFIVESLIRSYKG